MIPGCQQAPRLSTDAASPTPQQAQTEVATNIVTYEKGGPDALAAKARIIVIAAIGGPLAVQRRALLVTGADTRVRERAI